MAARGEPSTASSGGRPATGERLLPSVPASLHPGLLASIGSSITGTSFLEKAYGEPELDDEGEPLPEPRVPQGVGWPGATFALLKAYIGPAMLYLPRAWMNGGWLFTTLALPPVAIVSTFCLARLVRCRALSGQAGSYGDLLEEAVGPMGRRAVNFSVVTLQSGTCCTYFIFIASIIKRILLPSWSLQLLTPGLALLLVPLTWIRQVRRLTFTSLLADVLILGSVSAILSYEAREFISQGCRIEQDEPVLNEYHTFGPFVALGTLVFAFEGIALVLPIYDTLREPRQFMPLMITCVLITSAVMLLSGTLGYATFGMKTESIVLLNLPADPLFLTVQIAYAIAVVFTFPLQLLPAVRVLEGAVFAPRERPVQLKQKVKKSLFRSLYVCLLAALSILGQTSFDHFVSLIGVACGIPLAFIYPCICHFRAVAGGLQRALDVGVAACALAVALAVAAVDVALWVA